MSIDKTISLFDLNSNLSYVYAIVSNKNLFPRQVRYTKVDLDTRCRVTRISGSIDFCRIDELGYLYVRLWRLCEACV